MKFDSLIMKLYINIGTPKTCLFVLMSNKLLGGLRKYPVLYDAVEEALISAKNGYYSIGVIVWCELLKSVLHANSKQDSDERNISAHDFFKIRQTKKSYDNLLDKFKKESEKCYLKELAKTKDKKTYISDIQNKWEKFMKELPSIIQHKIPDFWVK